MKKQICYFASTTSILLFLVACGQSVDPKIGIVSGTTVEIQTESTQTTRIAGKVDTATLDGSKVMKFTPEQLVVKIGNDPGRAGRLKALMDKFGGTLLDEGVIPPSPAEVGKIKPSDIKRTDMALISVNPSDISAIDLAQKLSEKGIKGKIVISSQKAANVMFTAFNNDQVASINQVFDLNQSVSYPEHLQSGFYSSLPPASANFLTTNNISALLTMKVTSPTGAWTLRKPGSSTWLDGTGIQIAIIDIGFDTNNFDITRTDALYATAFPPRTVWSYNFNDNNYNVNFSDGGYHGLRSAAAAGAARGNHYGNAGAAPGSDLFLFRAVGGVNQIDSFKASTAVATAVSWGADVISMSFGGWMWGGAGAFYPMNSTLQSAVNNNVIPVAAAGNEGGWFDKYPNIFNNRPFPACLSTVLTVGAHDQSLIRSVWNSSQSSNFGPGVDIYGPGGGFSQLTSTPTPAFSCATIGPVYCTGTPNYSGFSGTSAAAPAVAGVVALLKQVNPSMNLDTARNILRATRQLSPDAQVNADGGIVDAAAALRSLGAL